MPKQTQTKMPRKSGARGHRGRAKESLRNRQAQTRPRGAVGTRVELQLRAKEMLQGALDDALNWQGDR